MRLFKLSNPNVKEKGNQTGGPCISFLTLVHTVTSRFLLLTVGQCPSTWTDGPMVHLVTEEVHTQDTSRY